MKKTKFLIIILSLLILAPSCLIACENNNSFELPYYDGQSDEIGYNSTLFYKNDFSIFSGDPSIIWVSKEQSEEYGGYFYMYTTSNDGVITRWYDNDESFAFPVLRSTDLADWTPVGEVDGLCSLLIKDDEWLFDYTWAPEVVWDSQTGKYFMYFSGRSRMPSKDSDVASECVNSDKDTYERFYLGIAISNTPIGPFRLVSSENYYGDKNQENLNGKVITAKNPAINFTKEFYGKEYDGIEISDDNPFACIDAHMFLDDNGKMYLYFVKHVTINERTNSIWVVEMKDMITPDYTTLTKVAQPSVQITKLKEGSKTEDNPLGTYLQEGSLVEGTINEGPHVIYNKDSKKYYLTYSPHGFSSRHYSVVQAVGDTPYGPFTKIRNDQGRVIIGADDTNDFLTATGHHCFVKVADEIFCGYFASADPLDGSVIARWGRGYAFDRVMFKTNEMVGYETLYGNGPTLSLQPLPEITSTYKNVAKDASITASNAKDKDSVKYLNDGLFTAQDYAKTKEFTAKKGTKITIKFDTPTAVKAIMIYNSYDYFYAFSSIDSIKFKLAKNPAWYKENTFKYAAIKNLAFSDKYYNSYEFFMRPGGSAMAEFNEILVTEIEISISKKLSLVDAQYLPSSQINVSEIVVLGR